jgi:hypothetical protein
MRPRRRLPEATASCAHYIRVNYVVTAAWALAFAVIVAADCLLLYAPDVSPRIGIIVTILAIVGAFKFTSWYPDRVRSQPVR